ncbi:MAG: hypothetical protein ABSC15_19615 [Terriglobales bacterium]|jgi:hypothetical protein
MRIPKKVTPRKAAANKRNAARSTGPKSQSGKRFASRNAITHGIYAAGILLPGESKKEFDQLWNERVSSHCPVGSAEFHRVGKLVWHELREKRLRLAETGVVAKLLADQNAKAEMLASTHLPQYNSAVTALKRLKEIEEQINSTGCVSTENIEWLGKLPHGDELKNFLDAIEFVRSVRQKGGFRPGAEMPAETETKWSTRDDDVTTPEVEWDFARALLLGVLDSLKTFIEGERFYHGQQMVQRSEGQRNALLVPQEAELDRLMRYDKHISSQYDRDELALERMQRLRRGEKVPPPPARF